MAEKSRNGSAAVQRLRSRIDSGDTGSKIGAVDPAAAPLGTDDEAAGTPPTLAAARLAIDEEVGKPGRGRVPPHEPTEKGVPWSLIAMLILIIVIAGAAYFALR